MFVATISTIHNYDKGVQFSVGTVILILLYTWMYLYLRTEVCWCRWSLVVVYVNLTVVKAHCCRTSFSEWVSVIIWLIPSITLTPTLTLESSIASNQGTTEPNYVVFNLLYFSFIYICLVYLCLFLAWPACAQPGIFYIRLLLEFFQLQSNLQSTQRCFLPLLDWTVHP